MVGSDGGSPSGRRSGGVQCGVRSRCLLAALRPPIRASWERFSAASSCLTASGASRSGLSGFRNTLVRVNGPRYLRRCGTSGGRTMRPCALHRFSPHGHDTRHIEFHFVANAPTSGPPSLGDTIVLSNDLYQGDRKVGFDGATCTAVAPGTCRPRSIGWPPRICLMVTGPSGLHLRPADQHLCDHRRHQALAERWRASGHACHRPNHRRDHRVRQRSRSLRVGQERGGPAGNLLNPGVAVRFGPPAATGPRCLAAVATPRLDGAAATGQ
jgi:hypothetical protein